MPAVTIATAAPAYAISTTDGSAERSAEPTTGAFVGPLMSLAAMRPPAPASLGEIATLEVVSLEVRTAETSRPLDARTLTTRVTFPQEFLRSAGHDAPLVVGRVSAGWEAEAPKYQGVKNGRKAVVTFTYTQPLARGARALPLSFTARMDGRVVEPFTGQSLEVLVNAPGFPASPGAIAVR